MSEPYLGMVILFPYNFAPRGWAFCNGQIMSIAQNTALFSLLGTTYGGNGQTTFALPDLRGRVPMSAGTGPGLSNRTLGELAGVENVTLVSTQMPVHTHNITHNLQAQANATTLPGTSRSPANALPALEAAGVTAVYNDQPIAPNATLAAGAVSLTGAATAATAGGSQPFGIVQPYLVLNYCIALEGIYPSRN
jgi:microcystin-dependent protein